MMEEFKKMLQKKLAEQGSAKNDDHIKAKANMAKELSDTLGEDIASNLKPSHLKKVTVASDSEEGLEEGLHKAEDIIKGKSHTLDHIKHDMGHPDEESLEEDASEGESAEELEVKIAELQKQLEELKSKKA